MPQPFRFAAVALLALWFAPAAADPLPLAARSNAWHRFAAVAGASASIRWSPRDGVPVSVRAASGSTLPGFPSDRAAAVRSMFRDHVDLFRLRPGIDDFHAIGERESRGVHHFRMAQTWRGIPVRGGQYLVSVGDDGRLRMIGGRSVPEVDADDTPRISERRAIDAAASSLHLSSVGTSAASLAIEPAERERDRLVWQVVLGTPGRAGEWEVLVDAGDGSIVATRTRAFGAAGCAAIYDPSPLVPAREDDFVIADPAPGTPARLEGPNVRVLHETAPEAISSTFANGCFDFRFDPVTQPESFDQANVYWRVDHYIREFLGGNGFPGLPEPMTVILRPFHCGDPNTGETIGQTVWLTSEGCGYKSSTRDADIIDHETQHVINNFFGLESGLDLDQEIYATALHESFANFFSCAAHDDPVYAEYFFGPQGFANCNSDPAEYNYSQRFELGVGQLQNYRVGMIWSGALWDIRQRIGPIIDRIALESLYYLPAAPSFHNAVDAVLQVDRDLHGGSHQDEMIAAFARRGLGPGTPQISILGPSQVVQGQEAAWSARVCCGQGPWTYRWTRVDDGSTIELPMGTDSSITFAPLANCQLRVRVEDRDGLVVLTTLDVRAVMEGGLTVEIEGPSYVVGRAIRTWTARVSGQGADPVQYRWMYSRHVISDSMSATTVFFGTSTLRVLVSAGGKSASASFLVTVNPLPTVEVWADQNPIVPGQTITLWGSITGANSPFTWRWTRNGTAAENLVATTQNIQVTGDSIETDYYLVATAQGLSAVPVKLTISPAGVPLVVRIEGPDRLHDGASGTWTAVFAGAKPPTVEYRWTRTCRDPGCVPEVIGFGQSVIYQPARGFDLDLNVSTGMRTASIRRSIDVQSVPLAPPARPGRDPSLSVERTTAPDGETLAFGLAGPAGSPATLEVRDIAGRRVARVYDGHLIRGVESVSWPTSSLPSGIYLAVARIGAVSLVQRVIVVR